jgi:phage shock protein A
VGKKHPQGGKRKMSIFKRIKTMIQADIHALLDTCENPIAMAEQYSREMREEIANAQQALAKQLFIEKKYKALLTETEAMIAKRMRQAELAVDKGDEKIAQMAIQEKIKYEKNLALYKEQYESIKQQTPTLYEQIKKLEEKYNDMQSKKLALISRANAAQAIKNINQTLSLHNAESIAQGFSCIEERIWRMEADAKASGYTALTQKDIFEDDVQEEVKKELERIKEKRKEEVAVSL